MPRKNLREFRGKPLVMWAVEHAEECKYIDFIICSTDDAEIEKLVHPKVWTSMRPAELSTDAASSEDTIRHVLVNHPHDWVVLLQPTSPLRTAEDIDACIERAQLGDGCISVNRANGLTNGAVYVARASWIAVHDFNHLGLMKYVMDEERSLDIDNEEDFQK